MFGFGAALAYTPTIAILGHYFKRYLGIVSGFVTCGSSLFTMILPKLLTYLLSQYGLKGTFFLLGSLSMVVIVCALVYKPLHKPPPPPKRKPGQSAFNMHLRSLINLDNWKRKRYVVWALSIPIALIGYFVPYVHMAKYVEETHVGYDKSLPIICIGLTSGIGRIFFGYIADFKCVNRIFLQQMSFVIMGLLTIAIPLLESYPVLIAISLGMGIVDGCFISLLGPVAFGNFLCDILIMWVKVNFYFFIFVTDLCGAQGATQGIGFLLGLCSIPLTAGAPIAGFLYDETKSYRLSFIMAGIPAIVGAALMSLINCMRDERVDACDKQTEDQIHKLLNKPAWTEGLLLQILTKLKWLNLFLRIFFRFLNNFFAVVVDITLEINEKHCNSYTFQHENDAKLAIDKDKTGINSKSPLINDLNASQIVVADAYCDDKCYAKRKYNYSVLWFTLLHFSSFAFQIFCNFFLITFRFCRTTPSIYVKKKLKLFTLMGNLKK